MERPRTKHLNKSTRNQRKSLGGRGEGRNRRFAGTTPLLKTRRCRWQSLQSQLPDRRGYTARATGSQAPSVGGPAMPIWFPWRPRLMPSVAPPPVSPQTPDPFPVPSPRSSASSPAVDCRGPSSPRAQASLGDLLPFQPRSQGLYGFRCGEGGQSCIVIGQRFYAIISFLSPPPSPKRPWERGCSPAVWAWLPSNCPSILG